MTRPIGGFVLHKHTSSSLCPEAALRDAMTDEEFWDYVFGRLGNNDGPDSDEGYDEHDPHPFGTLSPCPLCGEYGACAYDDQGRALIHTSSEVEE